MDILTLHPRGSFSLLESRRFLEGFAPAGREATLATGPMRLAFPVEGDWRTAGVALTQSAEGAVRAELTGPPPPGWPANSHGRSPWTSTARASPTS